MAKTEAGMSRSRSRRLMVAIGISAAFFLTEISGVFFSCHLVSTWWLLTLLLQLGSTLILSP
jgi:hypothetical protein